MLQEISKEVADANCCARDHQDQEMLSKTEMLVTTCLEKVHDIEGKVTLLAFSIFQFVYKHVG